MEHAKHIVRAVLILVVVATTFVFVRSLATPRSFGMYGAYRFDSVAEYAAAEPVHGAPGACAECHEEQTKALSGGKHASVSCEVCHAPLAGHVTNGEQVGPMPVRRSFSLCANCHQRLTARPKDFPQVVLAEHLATSGSTLSEGVCLECHKAHDPGI